MRRFNLAKNVYYHVYNRAVSKMTIFKDSNDYDFFMCKISLLEKREQMEIVKFCLMPNHFHFILRNNFNAKFISRFMKSLKQSYALHFNHKYNHCGHVFEGPYHNNFIKSEADFERIKKYIDNNPVKAGLVKKVSDWPYRR